jgi:hypothetical protein
MIRSPVSLGPQPARFLRGLGWGQGRHISRFFGCPTFAPSAKVEICSLGRRDALSVAGPGATSSGPARRVQSGHSKLKGPVFPRPVLGRTTMGLRRHPKNPTAVFPNAASLQNDVILTSPSRADDEGSAFGFFGCPILSCF